MDKHHLTSEFTAERIEGIRVNRNRPRSLLLGTGNLLVLTVLILGWETVPSARSPIFATLLICSILMLGPVAIGMIYLALLPGPFLLVNQEGITIASPLIGTGIITWSEIALLRRYDLFRGDIFSIQLRMPSSFLARRTRLQRWWLQYLHVRSPGHDTLDSVDVWLLSLSVHDLLVQIEQRYGHELQHAQIRVLDDGPRRQSARQGLR